MQRLKGADANWLFQETPTLYFHTVKIHLIEVPGGEAPMKDVRRLLQKVVQTLPMLRKRVVEVPYGLHHPVLVDDPNFNLDFHIIRLRIPSPGTMEELEDCIGDLSSMPLNRSRPLWELWVLEGLGKDHVALVLKIHHTLADGMASAAFISRLFQTRFDDLPPDNWDPAPLPTSRQLILGALKDHIKQDIRHLPAFIGAMYRSVRNMSRHAKHHPSPFVQSMTDAPLPRTRINYSVSDKRLFATLQLSLDEVRAAKSALGCTINDCFLAMMTSALRCYLQKHNDLPDRPMAAIVPISVDEKGVIREFGNNIAQMMCLLPVHIEDPLERFQVTCRYAKEAKAEADAMGKATWGELQQYVPPGMWASFRMNEYRKQKASKPDYKPAANVLLSNVPGPSKQLANMTALYSCGPINEGTALNGTVWSYNGQFNFSLTACRQLMPDLKELRDMIAASWEELQSLAATKTASDKTGSSAEAEVGA